MARSTFDNCTVLLLYCKRISAFGMWCCRRQLSITWTARKGTEFVLDADGHPESLEGRATLIKLRYYGHCIRKDGVASRRISCWE